MRRQSRTAEFTCPPNRDNSTGPNQLRMNPAEGPYSRANSFGVLPGLHQLDHLLTGLPWVRWMRSRGNSNTRWNIARHAA